MNRLSRRFYSVNPLELAPKLLGRFLVAENAKTKVVGRIVEVEAYWGSNDPGSHAYRGQTPKTKTMFGPPGHLYVYFTYGMHWCSNVVCERDGTAGAVLLRAIEPVEGMTLMARRRGVTQERDLARGPARLTQALGINGSFDGTDLVNGPIWISRERKQKGPVAVSGRVGLNEGAEFPWRFYEAGKWRSATAEPRRNTKRKRAQSKS